MQMKLIALLAASGLAAAQLSAVPQCALGCAAQAAVASGCDLTDYKCQCTTGQAKSIASLTPCVCKSGCSKDDQAKLVTALNNLCASADPGYKPVAADPNACGGGASSSSAAPESSTSAPASSSMMETSSAMSSAMESSTSAPASSSMMETSSAMSSGMESSTAAPASSTSAMESGMSSSTSAAASSSTGSTTNGAGFVGVDTALMGLAGLAAFAL